MPFSSVTEGELSKREPLNMADPWTMRTVKFREVQQSDDRKWDVAHG